jgi:hypothetical protein
MHGHPIGNTANRIGSLHCPPTKDEVLALKHDAWVMVETLSRRVPASLGDARTYCLDLPA